MLSEFGHSDRNGGIFCKKRKNSAKIGMVGSYVTSLTRVNCIAAIQHAQLSYSSFYSCTPWSESILYRVSRYQIHDLHTRASPFNNLPTPSPFIFHPKIRLERNSPLTCCPMMEVHRVEPQTTAVHTVRQNQMEEGDLEIQVEDAYRVEEEDHRDLL